MKNPTILASDAHACRTRDLGPNGMGSYGDNVVRLRRVFP
jgi:hypothetical protein